MSKLNLDMANCIPIKPSEKPLKVTNIPENILNNLDSDLLHTIDWEIIPYDYDSENNDMVYFELIVEGRKVISKDEDKYGESWKLGQKERKWFYQVIINDEIYDEFRYNLDESMQDVLHHLREFNKFSEISDTYPEFTTWELYEVNETIMDIQEKLDQNNSHITQYNSISVDNVEKIQEDIKDERSRIREIERNIRQLESVIEILDELKT